MEILTLKEASTYLALKPSKLYRLTSERQIPFYKIGNLCRFDKSELDQWLQTQSVPVEAGHES